ncbi:MAG: PQQ-binding-like beta-propeller repeat protein [Bacteroidota bacterium]
MKKLPNTKSSSATKLREIRSALAIGRDSSGKAERLYFEDFKAKVYALDLKTQKLLWKVQVNDHPVATITGSLNVYEDKVFVPLSSLEIGSAMDENYECCIFRRALGELDKENGKQIWKNHIIAETLIERGKNSQGAKIYAPSGAPIWTSVNLDYKRRALYVGTDENYTRLASKTSDAIISFSMDDGETLYVPINDRGLYDLNPDKEKSPGMHALHVADGKPLWSTIEEDRCATLQLRGCGPGISAAITLSPEVVFGGTLDGFVKAYARDDGQELWAYDTKRDFEAVNGVKAFGGAIDSDGPVVVENQVFISLGYAKFSEKVGNVLLAFEVND